MRMVVSSRGVTHSLDPLDDSATGIVTAGIDGEDADPEIIVPERRPTLMSTHRPAFERRGPFVTTLVRYPGKGGWTFAPIPKKLAPEATRPWGRRLMAGGRQLFAGPRAAVLRSFLFNHWYHHRGQLLVYLRLLDVPVPSVYGPSADENPFADV